MIFKKYDDTAMVHDHTSMAPFFATNATLASKLATVNIKLVKALTRIMPLTNVITGQKRPSDTSPAYVGGNSSTHKHYCWPHSHRCNYPRPNCQNSKDGHEKGATRA